MLDAAAILLPATLPLMPRAVCRALLAKSALRYAVCYIADIRCYAACPPCFAAAAFRHCFRDAVADDAAMLMMPLPSMPPAITPC